MENCYEDKEEQRERKTQGNSKEQQDDFDFWSMPQDNYGKKKEAVQDSSLWVNEKSNEGGLFFKVTIFYCYELLMPATLEDSFFKMIFLRSLLFYFNI